MTSRTAGSSGSPKDSVQSPTPFASISRSVKVSDNLRFVTAYQADPWTALGDPTRRTIVGRLAERPRSVGELAQTLPVSRPAVSQHLKVLKDAGLVVDRAAGTRRIYQLDADGLDALRAQLDGFWTKALAAYKEVAEHGTEEVT
jgi:DNA-binding transcriptional ArsR family regulator